jgi:hypothetical protein
MQLPWIAVTEFQKAKFQQTLTTEILASHQAVQRKLGSSNTCSMCPYDLISWTSKLSSQSVILEDGRLKFGPPCVEMIQTLITLHILSDIQKQKTGKKKKEKRKKIPFPQAKSQDSCKSLCLIRTGTRRGTAPQLSKTKLRLIRDGRGSQVSFTKCAV